MKTFTLSISPQDEAKLHDLLQDLPSARLVPIKQGSDNTMMRAPMTEEEFADSIEASLAQADAGLRVPMAEVKQRYGL